MSRISLVGVHHALERENSDINNVGKVFINEFLEEEKPDLIFLEKGYYYETGTPMNEPSENYKESYFAVKWARKNKKEFKYIDFDEPFESWSWKAINYMREHAIADKILASKDRYNKIVCFIGENHRRSIAKLLGTINSIKMTFPDDIKEANHLIINASEPIKFVFRKIFKKIKKSLR